MRVVAGFGLCTLLKPFSPRRSDKTRMGTGSPCTKTTFSTSPFFRVSVAYYKISRWSAWAEKPFKTWTSAATFCTVPKIFTDERRSTSRRPRVWGA